MVSLVLQKTKADAADEGSSGGTMKDKTMEVGASYPHSRLVQADPPAKILPTQEPE